jgi:hypothetical protein
MFQRVILQGRSPTELAWEQFLAPRPPGFAESNHTPARKLLSKTDSTGETLIVLPHATMHPDLPKLLDNYWKSLPDDWDLVTLGAYFKSPPTFVTGHVFRPTEFSAIHGLALRGRAVAVLRDAPEALSVEDVLNSQLAFGRLNIYAIWPNLIVPVDASGAAADHFNSFRQLGQHGRTGNQFFQVSATMGAAVRHGFRPQFPVWKTSEILSEHFDQQLNPGRISATYKEPEFHFTPIPSTPDLDLFGVFQSPRYFAGYGNLIRQYLHPSTRLADAINSRFGQLLAKPTVGLHVRRADYVGLAHAFVPLSVGYYRAAMRLFPTDSHFVVFSDDPTWCRTAFKDDHVEVISGNPGYADLYLMAACRHQIIANSSFSWWAAYLNPNPDKRVVAPKNWFGPALAQNDTRDLVPSDWINV